MSITIVKEKKQRERTSVMADAVAILGELVDLKKLAIKIDKGTATLAEKRRYKKLKPQAWAKAERRFAKASVLSANGKGR
jgi:hypothetical protein